jgi:2-succinyl-5-enolpyruvyl-6-hydroxy-3-cyclohexene-1-carboxylate synthase
LSTAAGHSLKTEQIVGCIIGDLSFFYDANALWNVALKQNFIVLLLNNNRGKIFYKFNGLKNSPALAPFIAASHDATAEGICRSYAINHKQIHDAEEIKQFILEHVSAQNSRPLVLEYICE